MSYTTKSNDLLVLPREVRDRIIEMVLLSEDEAPPPPTEDDDRREEDQSCGCIWYQHTLPPTNIEGLLGFDRQLRQEALQTMNRINRADYQGVQYKLDLAVIDCSLQPTWTLLSAPPKYVKQVTVNFRMFTHDIYQWENKPAEEAGVLTQYLLQMLRRFLLYGPKFTATAPGRTVEPLYSPQLDTIRINFETTTVFLGSLEDGSEDYFPKPVWDGEPCDDPEEISYQGLRRAIDRLVWTGLLYGKVGEIKLRHKRTLNVWPISEKERAARYARRWSQYGWGPILGITQDEVNNDNLTYSEELDCGPPESLYQTERRHILRGGGSRGLFG